MNWRHLLLGLAATVAILIVVAVSAGFYAVGSAGQRDEPPNQVLALPSDYVADAPAAPYRGPHPSQRPVPEESFPFPIRPGQTGPVKPLFAGPLRYPFLCQSEESGLGQPLVDNQEGAGMAVYATGADGSRSDSVVGYSKDCSLPTRVAYYYLRRDTGEFLPLAQAADDIERIEVGGREIDFVVRVETGTINRYIYAIAALRGPAGEAAAPDGSNWNGRLIYQFRGGIGIGHRQGVVRAADLLKRRHDELRAGYAVAYSSGNQTSTHYDPMLAADTALRVKRQFVATYGMPRYTVGIGGSGGAIQQYLLAQNTPGILDALLPLYSYPDMITQTPYGFDCELLEYFFDVTDRANPRWRDWSNRSLVEGLNARDDLPNDFARIYALVKLANLRLPVWRRGLSECVAGWRGAAPLVNNPNYFHYSERFADDLVARVKWSHWDNLRHVYGIAESGHARRTFDNVGVQYGLAALRAGELTVEEFLRLNARVGGWKAPAQMQPERYWNRAGARSALADVSPWSDHNMNHGDTGEPAPRTAGDVDAIAAAYRGGLVFLGDIDLPVIDVRHYLEDELNMHHSVASLAVRRRIERANGHSGNLAIWMTRKPHDPTPRALAVIDRWMANLEAAPGASAAEARPEGAADACFDAAGNVIAAGDGVWDGPWNGRPAGACLERYPPYSTSRMVAGEDVAGDTLKCALQPVDRAIAGGVYGDADMRGHRDALLAIFPDGVCDYGRPGIGHPSARDGTGKK